MKDIVKKIAIFSMVGMMQLGLGATVIEASPLHNDSMPMQQQYDREQGPHEGDRFEQERHERERHEEEMKRHSHEDERAWHERQRHENERHERELHGIQDRR